MVKIGKRTNHTREVERPPKVIRAASAAFWAEILRMAVKSAPASMRSAHKKAVSHPAAASHPAAKDQTARKPQPNSPAPAQRQQPAPASRFPQTGASGFNSQKPLPGSSSTGGRPNSPNNTNSSSGRPVPSQATGPASRPASPNSTQGRPAPTGSGSRFGGSQVTPNRFSSDRPGGQSTGGQQNNVKNNSSNGALPTGPKEPAGQASKTGNPAAKNPAELEKPAVQKPAAEKAPVPPLGVEKPPSAVEPPSTASPSSTAAPETAKLVNLPAEKALDQPPDERAVDPKPENKPQARGAANSEARQETTNASRESARLDRERRAEQEQRENRQARDDRNEGTHRDNPPEKPRENGLEKPSGSRAAPVNRNGHSRAPIDGVRPHNGNGSASSSSLFRTGAYSGMTSFRSHPSANGPEQIPLINPDKPGMTDHAPAKNGNGKTVEPPNMPPAAEARPAAPAPQPRSSAPQRQPLLKYLLHQHPELPAQSAIFGVGEDGLPVLVDLSDPGPGAVLAISDERPAELDLLRTVVASLASRNSARGVQFLIFSCDVQGWADWISLQGYERHILAVVDTEDDSIRDWTLQLADWTEQRRLGQRSGPPVVVIIDSLSFLTRLEYDVRLNFEWMAKEGPEAQIWPVAAISSELAKSLNSRRLLRSFQTRILGNFDNPADYPLLVKMDEQTAANFGQPGQFAVQLGDDWLRFRLLALR